jgi:uncharacterized protein YhaN
MRINEIYIDGYGIHHKLHLTQEQLSSSVILFYGQNEAGKSTLHSFIRSILFGFQWKGTPSYEALNGGKLGGSLILDNQLGESFQVERYSPPKKGKATVFLEDGREEGEAFLNQLLGGISAPVYANVFAFSHRELQRLDTLQGDEISAHLYSAAMGTGAANLLDIEMKMAKGQEQIFKPRASNPLLNQLLSELEELQLEHNQLSRKMDEYVPLQEKIRSQRERLLHLRQKREELEQERIWFEKAKKGERIKQQLQELQIQLQSFPEDSICLLPFEAEIYTAQSQSASAIDKKGEKLRIEEQMKQKEHTIAEALQALGKNWDRNRVKEIDLPIPKKDQLFQQARQQKVTREELDRLSQKREEKKNEVDRLQTFVEQEQRKMVRKQEAEEDQATLPRLNKSKKKKLPLFISVIGMIILPLFLFISLEQTWAAIILFLSLSIITFQQASKEKEGKKLYEQETAKYKQELASLQQEVREKSEELLRELHTAEQQLKKIEIERLNKEKELVQAQEGFSNQLAEQGLPHQLSLEGLDEMLRKIEEAKLEIKHLEQLQEKKKEVEQSILDWTQQVIKLAKKIDNDLIHHQPNTLIDLLLRRFKQEAEEEQQKKEISIKFKQFEAQLQSLVQEEEVEQAKLEQVIREWDEQQIRNELNRIQEEYLNILQEIESQATRLGQMDSERRELEQEETLSSMQQEIQEKRAHFKQLAKTWSAQALAQALCSSARKIYEEERQPSVLKIASLYLQKMTFGRYKQVIVPMGQQELVVIDQKGERMYSSQLSQGTMEQLYLSMRFAMMEEYGQTAKLPVILDDIFVNFDSVRLREALQGIVHLSREHQIILFTCHAHVVKQAQESIENMKLIDLSKL